MNSGTTHKIDAGTDNQSRAYLTPSSTADAVREQHAADAARRASALSMALTRLGVRVRQLRDRQKMTRQQLADRSGLSLRFLADVESGRANPSLGSLMALAEALHLTTVELLTPTDRVQSVALLGLRGAGKSTIGAQVARLLGWGFVEVDVQIEHEAGMRLSDLFALHGEAHYRTLEERVLRRLVQAEKPMVMATGGGVVTHDPSFRLLKSSAHTIWLKASPQEHWDRVVSQGDERPMQRRAQARIELDNLYAERAPLYAQADDVIETTSVSPDACAAAIVSRLRLPSTEA